MNKNIYVACLIKNAICVICFTVLAIIFHQWWIVFFSALFLSSVETVRKFYRVCDHCGKLSPYADSYNEAVDKANAAGWVHYVDSNTDYCPECKKLI